jgi:hypothetical protein
MSIKRRPSLLGALLWLGLGITFLLYNFGKGPDWLLQFRYFFPALLILLGVGKIIDFFLKEDAVAVRFGELVLLIFVFLIGALITKIHSGSSFSFFQNLPSEIESFFHSPEFTFTDESTYPFDSQSLISIDNSYGSVSVYPGTDREIRVRLKKVIYSDESRAKTIAGEIHLETDSNAASDSKSGRVFVIRTNRYALDTKNYRVNTDMEILVPKNSPLQIKNKAGEIRIAHINGNLDLGTSYKPIDVQDCNGKFNISARYTQCHLTNLIGDVDIKSEFSQVEVFDLDGKLAISSNQSNLTINGVAKPVVIDARGSNMRVEKLKDSLKIKTDHANLDLSDIASEVALETRYASLTLKAVKGNITINSDSDRINAENIDGRFLVRAHGSWIQASDMRGPVDIQTSLNQAVVKNFSDSCSVVNEGGIISVSAKTLGKGAINLKNQTGGIDLFLPESSDFEIDALAKNGKVESHISELQPFQNQNGDGVLKYKWNDGGSKILMQTHNSDIRIFNSQGNMRLPPRQKIRPKTFPNMRSKSMPASMNGLAYERRW